MHGVGFLVHKDIVNTVMGCRPVSSRLITIRLRAVPFNITIVQAYAPTSDYEDNKIEEFYDQLQNVIDQTPRRTFLLYKETGMQKSAGMLVETGVSHVGFMGEALRNHSSPQLAPTNSTLLDHGSVHSASTI